MWIIYKISNAVDVQAVIQEVSLQMKVFLKMVGSVQPKLHRLLSGGRLKQL